MYEMDAAIVYVPGAGGSDQIKGGLTVKQISDGTILDMGDVSVTSYQVRVIDPSGVVVQNLNDGDAEIGEGTSPADDSLFWTKASTSLSGGQVLTVRLDMTVSAVDYEMRKMVALRNDA